MEITSTAQCHGTCARQPESERLVWRHVQDDHRTVFLCGEDCHRQLIPGHAAALRLSSASAKTPDSVEQFPRCYLLRLIPSLGGFVFSESRDLGLCAGTARGSRTMANFRRVQLCAVVVLLSSQSRLKPTPQPNLSITSYTLIRISLHPRGSTKCRHHPPSLQSAAPCQAGSGGSQTDGNTATCATLDLKLPRVTCATLAFAYLEPPDSVRGSCGMLGSHSDSVRRRRASVRGSPLTKGTDTAQPRPQFCSCTHGPVCLEGPGTRPASAATIRPLAEEPCV